MNKCLHCSKETTNPKFCNSSCAASYNNRLKPKRERKKWYCKTCGAEVTSRRKYCANGTCFKEANKAVWYKELKPLVDKGLTTRNIAKIIDESQSTVMHRLKICALVTKRHNNNKCVECGIQLSGKQDKFCSIQCKRKKYKIKNAVVNYTYQQQRGKKRRSGLIELLGGQCEICGYKKNTAALVFHHKNPDEKLISLSMRHCSNSSMERLLIEVVKCRLLCANCHTELHHPEYNS